MRSIEPQGGNNPHDFEPDPVVYVPRSTRRPDRAWLELVERVLDSWPRTARALAVLVVLLSGLAVLAAALGLASTLLLAMLGRRFWRGQ